MLLKEIGDQLDNHDVNNLPRCYNGGIVMPNNSDVSLLTMGQEEKNEQTRKRRPTTRSRTRATTRERTSNRSSGTPSHTTPLICADIQAKYERQLDEVCNAYPHTRVWHQSEGLWLLSESNLLPGLWHKAVFLTGIPFLNTLFVRSWGFWVGGLYKGPTWIGPRHTNYPDGSVCAFEPKDGSWNPGDSIVTLLDLYTLWAVRHIYLQRFGHWPGRQAVHHPYERIMELKKNEYCGCDNTDQLYEKCCRKKDLSHNLSFLEKDFRLRTGGMRKVPSIIERFIHDQAEPPLIRDLLS